MGHVQIPGHIWVSLMYVCIREVHSGLLSYHYVHGADALQFLCPRIPMTFIEHRRFDRSKSAPPPWRCLQILTFNSYSMPRLLRTVEAWNVRQSPGAVDMR